MILKFCIWWSMSQNCLIDIMILKFCRVCFVHYQWLFIKQFCIIIVFRLTLEKCNIFFNLWLGISDISWLANVGQLLLAMIVVLSDLIAIYGLLILMSILFLFFGTSYGLVCNHLYLMLLKGIVTALWEIGILPPFWMSSLSCWRAAGRRRAVRHRYSITCLSFDIFRNIMLMLFFYKRKVSLFITCLLGLFLLVLFFSLNNVHVLLILWKNTGTILISLSSVSINLSLSWWPNVRHRYVTLTWLWILNFCSICLFGVSIRTRLYVLFLGNLLLLLESFLNFPESLVQRILTMPFNVFVNCSSYRIGWF